MNLRSVSFGSGIHFLLRERFFVTGQRNFLQKLFTGRGNWSRQNDFSGRKHSEKKSGSRKGPDLLPNILAEGDAVF